MRVEELPLSGLKLVYLDVHGDARGFFLERFSESTFAKHGLPTHFFQDNHSRSAPGILRGLHFQFDPPQGKLVGVVRGRIWDAVVDIRKKSPTYGQHYHVELSGDEPGKLLWVPPGFAHGFCVLGQEPVDLLYKVDCRYNPAGEKGVLWNDPDLKVPWPIENPTLSARDQQLFRFRDLPDFF